MVADAAYDALMKFDRHLHLGMRRYLQRINYVNLDAETTAVFIEAFSGSSSRDQGQDRNGRAAAAGKDVARVRRSKSADRQPAKQAYLQSTREDAGDVAGGRRRRALRVDLSAADHRHSDVVTSQTTVDRGAARRPERRGWSPDSGCETLTLYVFNERCNLYIKC